MQPIYIHRYELVPRVSLSARASSSPRRGALIRTGDGFADVHPWTELGDLPLDRQLAMLARGETTSLTRASLRFASLDADARAASRSIFEVRDELLPIPPSHLLVTDVDAEVDIALAAEEGFRVIKIKAGRDLDRERLWIESRAVELRDAAMSLRIDCNALPGRDAFSDWLAAFSKEANAAIDFIEDPFLYDASQWRAMRERYRVPLAIDRDAEKVLVHDDRTFVSADTLVLKPALDDVGALLQFASTQQRRVVVTSYMDHPVGQIGAAFVAARCAAEEPYVVDPCGLLTHRLYQNDAFIERVESDGPVLQVPAGIGIGFDDLLEGLPWQRLS